jgi:hypothetical protein
MGHKNKAKKINQEKKKNRKEIVRKCSGMEYQGVPTHHFHLFNKACMLQKNKANKIIQSDLTGESTGNKFMDNFTMNISQIDASTSSSVRTMNRFR